MVEGLELGGVAEGLEDGAVCLPEEAEPGGDDLAISAVGAVLARDGSEDDALGTLLGLKVLDVQDRLLGLALCLLGAGFSELQVVLDHYLQRIEVYLEEFI